MVALLLDPASVLLLLAATRKQSSRPSRRGPRSASPPPPEASRIETEATPIRYVAELLGTDTDSERSIRWVIASMVVCCAVTCSPSP